MSEEWKSIAGIYIDHRLVTRTKTGVNKDEGLRVYSSKVEKEKNKVETS
jgi:hypothetical protein